MGKTSALCLASYSRQVTQKTIQGLIEETLQEQRQEEEEEEETCIHAAHMTSTQNASNSKILYNLRLLGSCKQSAGAIP